MVKLLLQLSPGFHPQQYSPLLKAFTSQGLSELTLLLKIQEYCYDNIHFMKAFQKIVVLLYKGELIMPTRLLFPPSHFGEKEVDFAAGSDAGLCD